MRCYNGCPDSELQSVLDANEDAKKRLNDLGANATYFPREQMWLVFKDNRPVGEFKSTICQAADAYIASMKED